MKRKLKIKKFQLGANGIDIVPNPMWDPVNNLDAFQLQGQQIANENSPYIEIGSNQTITPDSPYQVNQKPLNQTKLKREFGLNAKNYANLQMLNSGIDAIGNLYNQGQQNQSIINQNPLSSMQFSNGRSNQSKYGYSFQKGGNKQNPPKIYTDPVAYNKAAQMYNDSLNLYNFTQLQKKYEPNIGVRLNPFNTKEFDKQQAELQREAFRVKNSSPNIEWDLGRYAGPASVVQKDIHGNKIKDIELDFYDPKTFPYSKILYKNNYRAESPDLIHKTIKPKGTWMGAGSNNDYSNTFPKQPVKYQPQQKTNTQKPQTISTTKGKVTGVVKPNQVKGSQLVNITQSVKKPTHPVTNMKRLPLSNYNSDNYKIQVKAETIPLPEMKLPQQGSTPFYGPGGTIIGYIDKNRKFHPAQQYTGAPNSIPGAKDKELLNNPELLKKYVQSIDTYKFQSGGFKWDNEDDEFLFEDEEEDTVNVAEQLRQNDEEVVNQELQAEVNEEDYINNALYADLMAPLKRSNYRIRQPYQSIDNTYATPSANLSLGNQQNQVYQYLQSKGLTKEAIAGIMGNIQHESSFNPGISGDNGTSFGLFQHHADRKNKLLNYLKERGLPANSVQGQIDFALQENPSLINQLNQAKSPQQAADIWVRKFEKPANVDKQSQLRQKASLNYYKQGGKVNDNNGYLINNLHNFTPKKIINSNHITTDQMAFPIVANGVPLYPNTGDYIFPTNKVVEKPMYRNGGIYYASNADIANLKQKRVKFRYV